MTGHAQVNIWFRNSTDDNFLFDIQFQLISGVYVVYFRHVIKNTGQKVRAKNEFIKCLIRQPFATLAR